MFRYSIFYVIFFIACNKFRCIKCSQLQFYVFKYFFPVMFIVKEKFDYIYLIFVITKSNSLFLFQIKKLIFLKLVYLYGAKNDGFVSSSSHLSNVSNRLLEIKVTQMYFDVSIRRNYTQIVRFTIHISIQILLDSNFY